MNLVLSKDQEILEKCMLVRNTAMPNGAPAITIHLAEDGEDTSIYINEKFVQRFHYPSDAKNAYKRWVAILEDIDKPFR